MKAEILYDAKINPLRKLKSLDEDEWCQIYKSMKKINKLILEYKEKCKNEKSYNEKNSEITPINTED